MNQYVDQQYYWVKVTKGGQWQPAQCSNYCQDKDFDFTTWYIIGIECAYSTKELYEIGSIIQMPSEIPQRTTVVSIVKQV